MSLPNPGVYYSTAGMPRGSRSVTFYRLNNPPNGSGTALAGTYLLENVDVRRPSTVVERRGVNNEPQDSSAVDDFVTLSGTAQLSTATTPTLRLGDYFAAVFDINTDGTGNTEWFFITEVANPESQGEAKKQTFTALKDYTRVAA